MGAQAQADALGGGRAGPVPGAKGFGCSRKHGAPCARARGAARTGCGVCASRPAARAQGGDAPREGVAVLPGRCCPFARGATPRAAHGRPPGPLLPVRRGRPFRGRPGFFPELPMPRRRPHPARGVSAAGGAAMLPAGLPCGAAWPALPFRKRSMNPFLQQHPIETGPTSGL